MKNIRLPSTALLASFGLGLVLPVATVRADLTLDAGFGTAGIALVDIDPGSPDTARALAVQSDGSLVLVGRSRQAFDYVALTRVDGTTGAVDTAFGDSGQVTFLPGIVAEAGYGGDGRAVAIQPADQKIVVAGIWAASEAGDNQVFIARFDTDGTLDPGFGVDGVVLIDNPGGVTAPVANAVALLSDGSIIVAGTGSVTGISVGFITGVSSTGFPIPGFTDAVVEDPLADSANFGFNALTVISGDRILAAGGGGDLTLARFTSSGAIDTSFSGDGIAGFNYLTFDTAEGPNPTYDVATALRVLDDGRILLAGRAANDSTSTSTKRVLARITAAGALDTGFGSGGFAPLPDVGGSEVPGGVGVRPSGDIVLVGQGFAPIQISPNGIALSTISGLFPTVLAGLEVLDDGDVVAAGRGTVTGNNTGFAAVRLGATDLADGVDTVPDPLVFTTQTGVVPGATITSNTVTISGLANGTPVPVSVQGAEYSIGCTATFTTTAATISNGQTVCLRLQASDSDLTAANAALVVGGVRGFFTLVTGSTTPDQFSFVDQTGVSPSTEITSAPITLEGLTLPTSISVAGAAGSTYSVGCTGTFTPVAGTVNPGAQVCVRHTSSTSPGGTTDTILRVGQSTIIADTFTSTTAGIADTTPDPFAFVDQVDVDLNATVFSGPVTISGINSPAPVTVSNGQYSIGCTGVFATAASVVSNGETICLRHFAAGRLSAPTTTTLTVGGVSATFTSTTRADGVPGSSAMDPWSLCLLAPLLAYRRRRSAL